VLPAIVGLATVPASNRSANAQNPVPAAQPQSGSQPGLPGNPGNLGTTADGTGGAAASGRIKINVVVADKLGHPVTGLQASDFTLLDNKQPQKLIGFRAFDNQTAQTDPVHVVIVVDM